MVNLNSFAVFRKVVAINVMKNFNSPRSKAQKRRRIWYIGKDTNTKNSIFHNTNSSLGTPKKSFTNGMVNNILCPANANTVIILNNFQLESIFHLDLNLIK